MNIKDILYFAPGIRFDEVHLNGPELPLQFRRRVAGFYVEPSEECVRRGYAFAAGVLLVSCIDALARLRFPKISDRQNGGRFKRFAQNELQSFSHPDLAKRFYDDFRNGLVHEGMLKNGAQFSLDFGKTLKQCGAFLIVNPEYLAKEVSSALDSYVDLLGRDDGEHQRLADKLREDFSEDFGIAGA